MVETGKQHNQLASTSRDNSRASREIVTTFVFGAVCLQCMYVFCYVCLSTSSTSQPKYMQIVWKFTIGMPLCVPLVLSIIRYPFVPLLLRGSIARFFGIFSPRGPSDSSSDSTSTCTRVIDGRCTAVIEV
jgi:hypothetical protein